MTQPWPTPTLQERLSRANRDLFRADMIDDFVRRQREMQRISTNIAAIEKEIAEVTGIAEVVQK